MTSGWRLGAPMYYHISPDYPHVPLWPDNLFDKLWKESTVSNVFTTLCSFYFHICNLLDSSSSQDLKANVVVLEGCSLFPALAFWTPWSFCGQLGKTKISYWETNKPLEIEEKKPWKPLRSVWNLDLCEYKTNFKSIFGDLHPFVSVSFFCLALTSWLSAPSI